MPVRSVNITGVRYAADLLLPISEDRSIDLSQEELETLCAAAARAAARCPGITIAVRLKEANHSRAEITRLNEEGTEDQRQWARDNLVPELGRFAGEADHLEKGIRLLLSPDTLPLGFPDGLSNDQIVEALRAFVRYEWEGMFGDWKPALELDLYSAERPRLSARLRLDEGERAAFLTRQGLPPDANLRRLQLLNIGFGDLGQELALKRTLPAVLSTLAFYAMSLEQSGRTFQLDDLPSVIGWNVGLA